MLPISLPSNLDPAHAEPGRAAAPDAAAAAFLPLLAALLGGARPVPAAPLTAPSGAAERLPQGGEGLPGGQDLPSALPAALAALLSPGLAAEDAAARQGSGAGTAADGLQRAVAALLRQEPAAPGAPPPGPAPLPTGTGPSAEAPDARLANLLARVLPAGPTPEALPGAGLPPQPEGALSALAGILAAAPAGSGLPAAAAPTPSAASAPAIPVPLHHPQWGQALGERVQWLVGQQVQRAEIRINPPDLGPLEVRLSLNQDHASVSFLSHHASVREAVEAAIPRLREMLAEQGLVLDDVNVSQQGPDQRAADPREGRAGGNALSAGAADPAAAADETPLSARPAGLLDVFA